MKGFTHITKIERKEIESLLNNKKQYGVSHIAQILKRSKSSISDEIRRNSVNGQYRADKAHQKAYVKKKYARYQGMKIVQDDELRKYVDKWLKKDISPEIISGRIREVDKHISYAGKDAIRKYRQSEYGKIKGFKKKNKYKKKGRKNIRIDGRKFIHERPNIQGNIKHFETDFIDSGRDGKGYLYTRRNSVSRKLIMDKLEAKTKDNMIELMKRDKRYMDVLTTDNDIVFASHMEMEEMSNIDMYFCNPYSSWEKGSIENVNRTIRKYIPKGTDISKISKKKIKEIENKINNRPLKCLGYLTPIEFESKMSPLTGAHL